jgi:hypothetical protein
MDGEASHPHARVGNLVMIDQLMDKIWIFKNDVVTLHMWNCDDV